MKKVSNVCGATASNTLFVGDLSILCSEADLYLQFSSYQAVNIEIQQESNLVFYGFIKFNSVEEATQAMREINGTMLHGRCLRIGWASLEKRLEDKSATVDLHFSFISKQIISLVYEQTIRDVFLEIGCSSVEDVEFKKYMIQTNSKRHFGNGFVRLSPSLESIVVAKLLCTNMKKISIEAILFDFNEGNTLLELLISRPDLNAMWHNLNHNDNNNSSIRGFSRICPVPMQSALSYATIRELERFICEKKGSNSSSSSNTDEGRADLPVDTSNASSSSTLSPGPPINRSVVSSMQQHQNQPHQQQAHPQQPNQQQMLQLSPPPQATVQWWLPQPLSPVSPGPQLTPTMAPYLQQSFYGSPQPPQQQQQMFAQTYSLVSNRGIETNNNSSNGSSNNISNSNSYGNINSNSFGGTNSGNRNASVFGDNVNMGNYYQQQPIYSSYIPLGSQSQSTAALYYDSNGSPIVVHTAGPDQMQLQQPYFQQVNVMPQTQHTSQQLSPQLYSASPLYHTNHSSQFTPAQPSLQIHYPPLNNSNSIQPAIPGNTMNRISALNTNESLSLAASAVPKRYFNRHYRPGNNSNEINNSSTNIDGVNDIADKSNSNTNANSGSNNNNSNNSNGNNSNNNSNSGSNSNSNS